MNFWNFIYLLLFIGIVVFIIALMAGNKDTRLLARKVTGFFIDIEHKYTNYAELRINLAFTQNENIDKNREQLINEFMELINPEIEAIIAIINATTYEDVKISYQSDVFSSVISVVESFFRISYRNEDNMVSLQDENDIFAAFRSAINADLMARIMKVKSAI